MKKTLIEHIEVGSGGAAEIEFTSIPQTYTDLMLVVSARCDAGGAELTMQFNNVGSGWSSKHLNGNGSSASSNADPYAPAKFYIGAVANSGFTASTFGSSAIYIPNYAGSAYKSVSSDSVSENNATLSYQNLLAGLWSNTAAVTSLQLNWWDATKNFVQYSSATLYGITSGSDGTTTVS